MCRSIKVLRVAGQPATRDEVSAAALQFVRKVSGFRKPSRANELVFNRAIVEISGSVERLLEELGAGVLISAAPPQQRQTADQREPSPAQEQQPVMKIVAPGKGDRGGKEHTPHQHPQHINRP